MPEKIATETAQTRQSIRERKFIPLNRLSRQTSSPTRQTSAALTILERSRMMGMIALAKKDYPTAQLQLDGYLRLYGKPDPEIEILLRTVELLLAINQELGILEPEASE